MKWENKIEMVRLLNNGYYKDAVEFFGKEEDWDDQAVDMFVTGFDLTQCELLKPIKEKICNVKSENFRIAMRLAVIQEYFDKEN